VIPAFAKVVIYQPPMPQRQDPYNCGVYVLTITEVIYEWCMKNEELTHELRDRVKELGEVHNMRTKYHQMIRNHEAVRDPAILNTTELENTSAEKHCFRDIHANSV